MLERCRVHGVGSDEFRKILGLCYGRHDLCGFHLGAFLVGSGYGAACGVGGASLISA